MMRDRNELDFALFSFFSSTVISEEANILKNPEMRMIIRGDTM